MHPPRTTLISLNKDLTTISKWIYQWKMVNPGSSKQTQKVVFVLKKVLLKELFTPTICQIVKENVQKHLGLFLDAKLVFFLRHINEKIKKANKGNFKKSFLVRNVLQ